MKNYYEIFCSWDCGMHTTTYKLVLAEEDAVKHEVARLNAKKEAEYANQISSMNAMTYYYCPIKVEEI